jgi:PadR family transcriptional regulator PadR
VFVVVSTQYMAKPLIERDLKRSSASLLVLALLEEEPLHGYEIGKRIEARSAGKIAFNAASLYPLLYRLEDRGWIAGRWQQGAGGRRRRFYRITAEGRRTLSGERGLWRSFVSALDSIANLKKA